MNNDPEPVGYTVIEKVAGVSNGCGNMLVTLVLGIVGLALLFALGNTVAPLDQLHDQLDKPPADVVGR